MLEGLLQSVRDTPEDDAPRLVLADWLEENGGPDGLARAEFIRVECRAHALPVRDPERGRLFERSRELQEQHGAAWSAGVDGMWSRGLFQADIDTERDADALLAAPHVWPWVESVAVGEEATPELLRPLLACRSFRWVRALYLSFPCGDGETALIAGCRHTDNLRELAFLKGTFGPEGWQRLMTSPHLAGLQVLDLGWHEGGGSWVPAVPHTPLLPNLSRLNLRDANIGDAGAAGLAAAPALGQLRGLNLQGNGITAAGAKALAAAAHLRPPLELIIRDNPIGGEGVQALLDGGVLPFGAELDLYKVRLGVAGARGIADCPASAGLTGLKLPFNSLPAEGLTVLAESYRLSGLTYLDLTYNSVGDVGAQALARSPHLSNLVDLELTHNGIGPGGAAALAAADLPALAKLKLDGNPLGVDGLRSFLAALRLPSLRELDLFRTGLGDGGVALLVESGLVARLRRLRLSGNDVTAKGARILAGSPDVDGLEYLEIGENKGLGAEGAQALRDRFGARVYTGYND